MGIAKAVEAPRPAYAPPSESDESDAGTDDDDADAADGGDGAEGGSGGGVEGDASSTVSASDAGVGTLTTVTFSCWESCVVVALSRVASVEEPTASLGVMIVAVTTTDAGTTERVMSV